MHDTRTDLDSAPRPLRTLLPRLLSQRHRPLPQLPTPYNLIYYSRFKEFGSGEPFAEGDVP